MGGAVTKLGKSAQWLPTEEDCRVKDFVTLLEVRLGGLLFGIDVGSATTSDLSSSDACTMCKSALSS